MLKTIKSCHSQTKAPSKRAYLERCLKQIEDIGYPHEADQINALKALIAAAACHADVRQYEYGTGWFMRLFNSPSSAEKALKRLENELNDKTAPSSEIKKL